MDEITRRKFLKFVGRAGGAGALTLTGGIGSSAFLSGCVNSPKTSQTPIPSMKPSHKDELGLAPGLRHQVLIRWKDPINSNGDRFGINNDFIGVIPFSKSDLILWVNHETPNSMMLHGNRYRLGAPRDPREVDLERDSVGASILRVKQDSQGKWALQKSDSLNRRLSAKTPIPFSPDQRIRGRKVAIGTMGNCGGGVTPWKTFLTCEENSDLFWGERIYKNNREAGVDRSGKIAKIGWCTVLKNPPEHYGWVVETDPLTGKSKKLVSLGRFAHEAATVTLSADGRPVVYMGDDGNDQCIYKFVSNQKKSLESGTLYVANTQEGKWIAVDRRSQPILKKHFKSQQEVLIRCREAAKLLGGTPQDRPEDIEIDPATGSVFASLTNNYRKTPRGPEGELFGHILKIQEENGDAGSLRFQASVFLTGGTENGFACPDNLAFDQAGNLWIASDITAKYMNRGRYRPFRNNGLFYVPLSGPNAGKVFQMASAPTDSELTGPCFSPDQKTLFLSVQSPGGNSKSLNQLTSHWPEGGNALPRSAVVAIQGPLLESLTRLQAQSVTG